jgi:hypothetical protein
VHFLEFRIQCLQARRGVWQFDWRNLHTAFVVTFVGTACSNGMLVFLLNCAIFTPLTIVLSWSVTWEAIKYVFGNTEWLVVLVIVPLVQLVIKFWAKRVFFQGRHNLRFRYSFSVYELYEILMTCVAGIMRSILRMLTVMVVSLLSLPRIDRSPFPAWVEYYCLLDTGSKSFQGSVKLYHWHNHPILRVAAWVLQEDSLKRRAAPEKFGMASKKKRAVSNRWWKLWMMTKNPALATYSKNHNVEYGDRKTGTDKEVDASGGGRPRFAFRKLASVDKVKVKVVKLEDKKLDEVKIDKVEQV